MTNGPVARHTLIGCLNEHILCRVWAPARGDLCSLLTKVTRHFSHTSNYRQAFNVHPLLPPLVFPHPSVLGECLLFCTLAGRAAERLSYEPGRMLSAFSINNWPRALQPLQSYSRQWRFSGSIMLMWVNCWLCKAVLLTVLACSVRSDFIIPIRPLFCCWPRNSCQYVPNWSPLQRLRLFSFCTPLLSMCLRFIISINKLSMLKISALL